jgi:excisionase family DNA binding protein
MNDHGTISSNLETLSVRQVASALRVGYGAAARLIESGELRSVQVGYRRRVPMVAIEQWLRGAAAAAIR